MNKPVPGPGTVVGANVKLVGTLKDTNEITIHGRVEGEVISDKNVLVGETATVKGPITAQVVTVAGQVRGAIDAEQKLEILPSGRVYGSISTNDLIIRSGATFVGKCTMPAKEEKEPKTTKDDEQGQEKGESEKAEAAYEIE